MNQHVAECVNVGGDSCADAFHGTAVGDFQNTDTSKTDVHVPGRVRRLAVQRAGPVDDERSERGGFVADVGSVGEHVAALHYPQRAVSVVADLELRPVVGHGPCRSGPANNDLAFGPQQVADGSVGRLDGCAVANLKRRTGAVFADDDFTGDDEIVARAKHHHGAISCEQVVERGGAAQQVDPGTGTIEHERVGREIAPIDVQRLAAGHAGFVRHVERLSEAQRKTASQHPAGTDFQFLTRDAKRSVYEVQGSGTPRELQYAGRKLPAVDGQRAAGFDGGGLGDVDDLSNVDQRV